MKVSGAKNQGFHCFYCVRVYEARYRIQLKIKLGALEAWLAQESDRLERFKYFLKEGIQFMIKKGGFENRVPWCFLEKAFEQLLIARQRQEIKLTKPKDHWMPYEDYVQAYGDPLTNQLSHRRETVNRNDIVIIPSQEMGVLERSNIFQADIESKVMDSGNAITGPTQLDDMQIGLMGDFFSSRSSGVSLDDMLKVGNRSASSMVASPAKALATSNQRSSSPSPPAKRRLVTTPPASSKNQDDDGENDLSLWFMNQTLPPASQVTSKASAPPPAETSSANTSPVQSRAKAKSKARAKAHAAGDDGGAGGGAPTAKSKAGGKRGRPKANRITVAETLLSEFKHAAVDEQAFFGSGRHATLRTMMKTSEEIKQEADAATDAEAYQHVNARCRRLSAAVIVLKVFISKGADHPEFVTAMRDQLHFLSLDPAQQDDFPAHMHASYAHARALHCSDADFWGLLAPAEISKLGTPEAISAQQLKLLSCKVLMAAKQLTPKLVGESLRKILDVKMWENADLSIAEEHRTCLNILHKVAFEEKYAEGDVLVALGQLQGTDEAKVRPLAGLLCQLPRGKAFCAQVADSLEGRKKSLMQLSEWSRLVGASRDVLGRDICQGEDPLNLFPVGAQSMLQLNLFLERQPLTDATLRKMQQVQVEITEFMTSLLVAAGNAWLHLLRVAPPSHDEAELADQAEYL